MWQERERTIAGRAATLRQKKEMTIRKGIAVSFLPCLVAFWGFQPYMFFKLFFCYFVPAEDAVVELQLSRKQEPGVAAGKIR